MKLIDKDALIAEINRVLNSYDPNEITSGRYALVNLRKFIDTLEVKECETKSGIVQKDLQIVLDDGMYIDLDPSMQLKPSFSVKEGERVKIVISKED